MLPRPLTVVSRLTSSFKLPRLHRLLQFLAELVLSSSSAVPPDLTRRLSVAALLRPRSCLHVDNCLHHSSVYRKVLAGLGETKGIVSWWLKKVLSEYPETKMTDEQQKEALGETYSNLLFLVSMKVLHLHCSLQRLCEILLAARSIYPKHSKLALALEKNLLVTSMLSISTEPQSQTTEEANAATEDTKTAAANGTQPNGIEAVVGGDKDEIMTEVEEEPEMTQ
ncbi:unnamed protein product [Brassica oleracea]